MNSLGVNPFVNGLYTDLKDGLVLLQVRNQDNVYNIIYNAAKLDLYTCTCKLPLSGALCTPSLM